MARSSSSVDDKGVGGSEATCGMNEAAACDAKSCQGCGVDGGADAVLADEAAEVGCSGG